AAGEPDHRRVTGADVAHLQFGLGEVVGRIPRRMAQHPQRHRQRETHQDDERDHAQRAARDVGGADDGEVYEGPASGAPRQGRCGRRRYPPAVETTARGDRDRFWWLLGAIALVAFGVRVWYVLTLARRNPTGGDPFYYHVQANLLADGKGFSE